MGDRVFVVYAVEYEYDYPGAAPESDAPGDALYIRLCRSLETAKDVVIEAMTRDVRKIDDFYFSHTPGYSVNDMVRDAPAQIEAYVLRKLNNLQCAELTDILPDGLSIRDIPAHGDPSLRFASDGAMALFIEVLKEYTSCSWGSHYSVKHRIACRTIEE